jgi:glucokinase
VTVLALDVGGSTARGALVSRAGSLIEQHHELTGDRDPGLRAVRRVAELLVRRAGDLGTTVAAVGAGFPEYVDQHGHLTSHEVLDWDRQPAELLADLAPRVMVDSDVRCGALGELHASGDPYRDFVYVSVGTGISYTLVTEGVLRRGARGEAIALGELPVSPELSGGAGVTLEQYSSGAAIASRFAQHTGQEVTGGARTVAERAGTGDQAACEVLATAGRALGSVLGELVALLDPGAVVLGGGLGTAAGPMLDATIAEYERCTARRQSPPPVVTSILGADAGIFGAARLAWAATEGKPT